MVLKRQVTFPAETGMEKRTAYIYLPRMYQREPERRFPVLYMFDGHNVFFDSDATYGKSWGLKEYLDWTRAPLIVAAVECSHDPDNGRLKEYAPYDFEDPEFGALPGRGEETMQWMMHQFKRDVDHRYRTLPDREHCFIAGSSMGGLMSLYAVLRHNNVYSRAAALSPSLWANRERMLKLARSARVRKNTVVYMDYGSREFGYRDGMRTIFREMTDALLEKKVFLTGRIVPDGTHCEACWEKQLPLMMNTLLYDMD